MSEQTKKNKSKNPLYVVKGKDVEEAHGVVDLIIKKFNLAPVISLLESVVKMLLAQVKDYPTFLAIKNIIDEFIEKYLGFILKRFTTA
jgi:hypothetical protein